MRLQYLHNNAGPRESFEPVGNSHVLLSIDLGNNQINLLVLHFSGQSFPGRLQLLAVSAHGSITEQVFQRNVNIIEHSREGRRKAFLHFNDGSLALGNDFVPVALFGNHNVRLVFLLLQFLVQIEDIISLRPTTSGEIHQVVSTLRNAVRVLVNLLSSDTGVTKK